jgi:DNA replication protein DnaC
MELQFIAPPKVYFKMPKLNEIDKKTPEQLEKIMTFAKNPKGFLLLAGANGTGKSFVAKAIYETHSKFKLPYYDMDEAFFINQADLNERWIREKMEGNALELGSRLKETKLLVIDDLGTKKPSDSFADFLYAIIDYRWNNEDVLGTIITTNMNGQVTREKFGDAILSRIASGIRLRFDGEDRRILDF